MTLSVTEDVVDLGVKDGLDKTGCNALDGCDGGWDLAGATTTGTVSATVNACLVITGLLDFDSTTTGDGCDSCEGTIVAYRKYNNHARMNISFSGVPVGISKYNTNAKPETESKQNRQRESSYRIRIMFEFIFVQFFFFLDRIAFSIFVTIIRGLHHHHQTHQKKTDYEQLQ